MPTRDRTPAHPSTPTRPVPRRRYVPDVRKLDPLDRRVSAGDLEWLRPTSGGPPSPPPPRQPPTTFLDPQPESSRAGSATVGREPIPFHPRWVVAFMLIVTGVWLCLYVASAYMFKLL